jgi:hypothetical protein
VALASFFISTVDAGAQALNLDAGGYLVVPGPRVSSPDHGPAFLAGPDGFTFRGSITNAGSQALLQCTDPRCTGGTTVSLISNFSDANDTVGTATFRGTTYQSVGSVTSLNSISITTDGSVVLPPVEDSGTVTAPFSFEGLFTYEAADHSQQRVPLTGTGTAVLSPSRMSASFSDRWKIDSLTYYVASPLPAGWLSAEVGHVGQQGGANYSSGTFDVIGSGADIWGTADAFHYAAKPLTGDGSITARVLTEQNTNPFAKAGLMIRGGFDASDAHVILDVKPDGSIEFMTRTATGANTTYLGGAASSFPVWLRLTRAGDLVVGAYSSDGVTWSQIGTADAPAAVCCPTGTLLTGLVVTSHDDAQSNESRFDQVTVTTAAPSALPAPWSSSDIGAPGTTGSASYDGGTFRVAGAGADVWGTADAFRFVWQPIGSDDASIVVRVLSQDATNLFAKTGVMIRASQDADAAHVMLDIRPDGSVEFMTRPSTGAPTVFRAGGAVTSPAWLKLERSGNQVSGYSSQDGSAWMLIGVAALQADFSTALFGVAVTSHDPSRLNTAVVDSVTVERAGAGGALSRSDWSVFATENAPLDPPTNAFDGNLNTRFSTGRGQHDSQGFIVSWPGDRTIGRIRIQVGPSTNDYPRTCGIWVKDSAGHVTFVNCAADSSGDVDVSFTPVPASKIEVWQWGTSGSWWSIAEFNVFPR